MDSGVEGKAAYDGKKRKREKKSRRTGKKQRQMNAAAYKEPLARRERKGTNVIIMAHSVHSAPDPSRGRQWIVWTIITRVRRKTEAEDLLLLGVRLCDGRSSPAAGQQKKNSGKKDDARKLRSFWARYTFPTMRPLLPSLLA